MKTIIKYTATVYMLLQAAAAQCQGLFIESGANIVTSAAAQIVINNGGLNNNGVFTAATGTVHFTGSAATSASFISGSTTTQFYNLVLNKSANGMQLNQHTAVSNLLNLLSGDSLFLNSYNIDLGSTGSLSGETNARTVTGATGGYIQSTQILNAPVAAAPGNMGFQITSSSNMGSTIVRRGHVRQTNGTNYGIARYFDILPSVNSSLNATIRFYYQHNELAGITEANLIPFTSSNLGVTWLICEYDILDIAQNFIERSGIDSLNRITLAGITAVLPVNQLLLNAAAGNGENLITWSASGENLLQGYILERSGEAMIFYPLVTVPAKGSPLETARYSFSDHSPLPGTSYYRLKLLESNNHSYWSQTVTAKQPASAAVKIFPNPAGAVLHTNYYSNAAERVTIRITGISGNTVLLKDISIQKGNNVISLNMASLSGGVYTLQVLSKQSNTHCVFIKAGAE